MSPTRPRQPFKYFSLFSGIGGFELGIQTAFTKRYSSVDQGDKCPVQSESCAGETHKSVQGGRCEAPHSSDDLSMSGSRFEWGWGNQQSPMCLGFSEIDKYATQVYKNNFNHKEYGNVSVIDWSDTEYFNLLVGGFPCQAFSIAGKRRGFCDTRGTLFFEIARCLREKQPRLFLLENVKGLLSHGKGKTFGVILDTLDELGYDLQWQVLNSKNFGVPQNRERVFIVGHLRGTCRPEVFPVGNRCQDNLEYIGGVVSAREKWLDDGKSNSRNFSQGQRIYSTSGVSQTLAGNAGGQGGKTGLYEVAGALSSTYFKRDNRPSNKSNRTRVFDCDSIRRLTPTECERLQGFPDGWTEGISNTQRYKCLGNAVTVNVIEAIMVKLLETL